MTVDEKRLHHLRLSALEDDAADDVTKIRPKFMIALIDEIERLRAEVATFKRDENLAADASLPKALDVIADQHAMIVQLRAALTEALDLDSGDCDDLECAMGDRDYYTCERCAKIVELRKLVVPT